LYRKVIAVLVLALLLGAAASAQFGQAGLLAGDSHLQAIMGRLQGWGLFRAHTDIGLALASFLKNLLAFAAALCLARAGAFHPARRSPLTVAVLQYAALAGALGYTLYFVFDTATATGGLAAAYGRQTGLSALLVLVTVLLYRLAEGAALLLVLAAPVFAAVRAIQVLSLRQSSYEGWLEARRRWRGALLLLAGAALLEVYLTPAVTVYLVRQ
jgi:hypothetical protein